MKKRITITAILCAAVLILCSCEYGANGKMQDESATKNQSGYMSTGKIDHCVVEPDDELYMSDTDREYYASLMDALLTRKQSVKLSNNSEKNLYYLNLLKESPYFFLAKSCTIEQNSAVFEYAYSKKEQEEKQSFLDSTFEAMLRRSVKDGMNELDIILSLYGCVSRFMVYDDERTDNKNIDSPLFTYPGDEVYNSLKTKEALCYGFAYTLRFLLLQKDIDCFCVYGKCNAHNEAHMWNVVKINGKFYNCDAAWDRSDDSYARLYHFGKTDAERKSDTLEIQDFSKTHFEQYGKVVCDDETFSIFRGISRFSYIKDHRFFMKEYTGEEKIFDTETMEFE